MNNPEDITFDNAEVSSIFSGIAKKKKAVGCDASILFESIMMFSNNIDALENKNVRALEEDEELRKTINKQ